jgi:hypothetical protein
MEVEQRLLRLAKGMERQAVELVWVRGALKSSPDVI